MTRDSTDAQRGESRRSAPIEHAYQFQGISIETVAARAGVTVRRVQYLQREGLLTPLDTTKGTRFFDESAVERIRLVERLVSDLGVNLPGAEVILHMRERMLLMLEEIDRMRRQ